MTTGLNVGDPTLVAAFRSALLVQLVIVAAIMVALALAYGILRNRRAAAAGPGRALGYAAGDRQASRTASAPRPAPRSAASAPSLIHRPALAAGTPVLTQATGTCSAQAGRELQLGVQVTNESSGDVTLGLVHPVLPLGGLRAVSQQWAPCSALADGQETSVLRPGASTWFSVTFEVLTRCPGALPVQFTVDYHRGGQTGTASVPGFPDLGEVPYAGCSPARG